MWCICVLFTILAGRGKIETLRYSDVEEKNCNFIKNKEVAN